jgi:hypothetical protein
MDIIESTRKYEAWLGDHIPLIQKDLEAKHQAMHTAAFPFLRATFYRWMQLWPETCPELDAAPAVLCVGDLHVENLGTWRDVEGRLVWGINDFDEAAVLPYTLDLVRLAASAILAAHENALTIQPGDACEAILSGYREGLEKGGLPFVLAESHPHLRQIALSDLRDPTRLWHKLDLLPPLADVPREAEAILRAAIPQPASDWVTVHRTAGLGSLGRQRYTVMATVQGGKVAREVKRLLVSACLWAKGEDRAGSILYQEIIDHAVRNPDPFTHLHGDWIVRRIAPDCSRIELADLPSTRDETRLLTAMGFETANIHLGSGPAAVAEILADLKVRRQGWLLKASQDMVKATLKDWEVWKSRAV